MAGDIKPGTTLTILLIPSITPAITIIIVIMKIGNEPLLYIVPINVVS
jgi:hypothetical protein